MQWSASGSKFAYLQQKIELRAQRVQGSITLNADRQLSLVLTHVIACGLVVCAGSSAMTMSVSDMLGADVETQGNTITAFAYSVRPAFDVQACLGRIPHYRIMCKNSGPQ
jgi:hypothetical protein